jgi:lysophospholipase L1-like esterase
MRCTARPNLRGKTLRQIVHISIGGHIVRIHISNLFGLEPLKIDHVRIALWNAASSSVIGKDRRILFDRGDRVSILPGSEAVSDPVHFPLSALVNVAISIHLQEASAPETCHQAGFQANYFADGDVSDSVNLLNAGSTRSFFYLTNVDVQDRKAVGSLVTLGASITDGYSSTPDANRRWPDDLAQRFVNARLRIGVLNQGISGNRLYTAGAGDSAESRFDRDVLAQPGVRWVIFSDDPINDLGSTKPQPTADQLIASLERLIAQAHARHVQFLCSTLTPYEGAGYWNAAGETAREKINQFMRSKESECDAIVDQDTATHDPEHPSRYLPAYDSGDHLHPNNAGLQAIADAVPLSALTR